MNLLLKKNIYFFSSVYPLSLRAASILWFVPSILALANAPTLAVLVATTSAFAVCAYAQLMNSRTFLIILPFIALLSPMTGFLDLGGVQFLFSDLIFLLLTLQAICILFASPIQRIPRPLRALFLVAIIATFFGIATELISLKPLFYLLQMVVVVFFTLRSVKSCSDLAEVRNSWIVAAVMGSVILLKSYVVGESLILAHDELETLIIPSADVSQLFRSSYYYSNFHFVLGICSVWAGIRLLFPLSTYSRAGFFVALIILNLALISSLSKTAILSYVLSFVVSMLLLYRRHISKFVSSAIAILLLLGAVLGFSLSYLGSFGGDQLVFMIDRFLSSGSLFFRFDVFANAVDQWFLSPFNMFFGYGPGMIESSVASTISQQFRTSAAGGLEGTVDSAWVSYLIELGLFGFLLLIAIFARGVVVSYCRLIRFKFFDEYTLANASLFGGLVFLSISMTTQMIGYSKISWLPLQLLVFALINPRKSPA